jgi:hypothetical protein
MALNNGDEPTKANPGLAMASAPERTTGLDTCSMVMSMFWQSTCANSNAGLFIELICVESVPVQS